MKKNDIKTVFWIVFYTFIGLTFAFCIYCFAVVIPAKREADRLAYEEQLKKQQELELTVTPTEESTKVPDLPTPTEPVVTEEPAPTEEPEATTAPTATEVPVITEEPTEAPTAAPDVTEIPEDITNIPEPTEPAVTDAPVVTEKPTATPEPTATSTPVPTATATPKPQYTFTEMDTIMYTTDPVNVRDLPSVEGTKIGRLSKGEAVVVTARCNETGWYEILFADKKGYLTSTYLTTKKPATPTPAPTATSTPVPTATATPKPQYTYKKLDTTMYATKDTTVWNVPYEGGTGVTTLNKDDEVKVTAQCNETGWYKVTVNKKTGYVSEDSLTTVKPEPPVPTEAPKEEDEIKLSFHGVFDTITIKDYSLFKKEIRIIGSADNVTVECKAGKDYLVNAFIEETAKENTYRLCMDPLENGITSVTLYLYNTDSKGTKTLYDSVKFTVKVSMVDEEEPEGDVDPDAWYADVVKDYPYKQHEWQYGDDIYVSVWTEKEAGYCKAIMIVDGTGAMWSAKETRELGMYLNTTGNSDVPWQNHNYTDYAQRIYEAYIAEGVTHVERLYTANLETVSFPSTLKSIGQSCFNNAKLKEIVLPEGVERLEMDAFFRCEKATKIELPSTLKYIGSGALSLQSTHKSTSKNLVEKVVLPENLEYIGYGAFDYRYGLEIIIPKNLDTSKFGEDWNVIGDE